MRLWTGWLSGLIVRTPGYQESLFPNNLDAIASLKAGQDAGWRRMDAVDWIYQSWAYDQHNVGTSPGFNGDYARALKAIKAKTLILAGSGDLLNPEYDAKEVARYITDVRYVAINESRPMGHLSGAGATVPENELQNREISAARASSEFALKAIHCVLYVVRSTWAQGLGAHRALRQLQLGTSFPVIGVTTRSLRSGGNFGARFA
jgi:homoserine O-acetyltransferase